MLAAAALACAVVAEGAGTMNPLFAILDELRGSQPVRQEWVEHWLGVSLAERPTESTEYFRVLHGQQSTQVPEIRAVELRVPIAQSATSGPMLILDIDASVRCVSLDEIQKHYGARPALRVPTPRQPASSPIDYEYHFAWGRMSFGISRSATECLTRVVVDFAKGNR
jgi:hypothetical protein